MRGKDLFRFLVTFLTGLAIMALAPGREGVRTLIRPVGAGISYRPVPQLALNEKILHIPLQVRASGKSPLWLEATLYRPEGPGPFPLVVLSHGTPRDALERLVRQRFEAQSWVFVKMGFAVVIPMRRGYGHSEGRYAEDEGDCEWARYYEAGMASANDLLATVRFMQAQPYIEGRRVILAGHSSGGFASLALASLGFDGLAGVINFSGGRGSKVDKICSPGTLIEAFFRFGRTCRVPTLWIYAENDTYFPPVLVRRLHGAFVGAGGPAKLVKIRPFLPEGHFFFPDVRGLDLWPDTVRNFLDRLGINPSKSAASNGNTHRYFH